MPWLGQVDGDYDEGLQSDWATSQCGHFGAGFLGCQSSRHNSGMVTLADKAATQYIL